ncbi:hypothetical protein RN001_004274 [Aquatica leii]|uniref:RING-type E3 ubiquitin transferase n=1 Tax=Aquatica leii TaxID=1421715 RepID=A0AAN7Q5N0_9COLE|nr:hypothetical protein RN001_004274 [Aquatica leii]
MSFFTTVLRMLLQISVFCTDVYSLKNVELTLEPSIVELDQNCTLICTYDLEDVPLYTVSWYRGIKEFYRYTPNETPSIKVFKTPGINVDEDQSNSTQVVLRKVEFNLSGNFTCEVTTEKAFSTRQDIKVMKVVQLPEDAPTIKVSTEPLDYGDELIANCMSPPSRPPALLKLTLNNKTVARTDPFLVKQMSQELSWSDLFLNLTLTAEHFRTGRLILRCEARIEDIYHKYAELKLNTARDPIPERVSAFDSSHSIRSMAIVNFVFDMDDNNLPGSSKRARYTVPDFEETVLKWAEEDYSCDEDDDVDDGDFILSEHYSEILFHSSVYICHRMNYYEKEQARLLRLLAEYEAEEEDGGELLSSEESDADENVSEQDVQCDMDIDEEVEQSSDVEPEEEPDGHRNPSLFGNIMDITDEILTSFLCGFCRDLMHPPMKLCVYSHAYCKKCNNNYKVCPICSRKKSQARNFALERAYELFKFPCNYRNEGCEFVGKGFEVKEHISSCSFIALDCPLNSLKCKWHGKISELFQHFNYKHPKHAVKLKLSSTMLRVYTRVLPSTFSQVIIQAHSELFLFTWSTNANRSAIKWSLVYLGSKENAERFYYTIEFCNPIEKSKLILMEAECQALTDYNAGIKIKSEVFSNQEYLNQMVKDIKFFYIINIKQKL